MPTAYLETAALLSPPTTPTKSTTFPQSPPVVEITFYEQGDLVLVVYTPKRERIHLRIASTALCIASPVFRAMLCPDRFQEGINLSSSAQSGQVCFLELPDDDPDSLITLCHILHFNNYKVPRSITTEALAKLCVLLDKYVCTLAAASWIDYWFGHLPNVSKTPESTSEGLLREGSNAQLSEQTYAAMWLFISWVAGDRKRFKHFSTTQIMNIPSLDCMDKSHREWFERLPGCIQDALINESQLALDAITSLIDNFCTGKLSPCKVPGDQYIYYGGERGSLLPTARDCEAHSIGALVQALQGKDFQPGVPVLSILTQTQSWGGSVNQYLDIMESVAQDLASIRPFVPPHHQCFHGKVLLRKLKELRFLKNQVGLGLEDFRSSIGTRKYR